MDLVDFFNQTFKSIPNYRNTVLLMFSFKNEDDFLTECGFLKDDINRLCIYFENKLIEQKEEYLAYIKTSRRIYFGKFF